MDSSQFIGTGVAVVTPFNADKSIDFDALEKLIEKLINNGIDYLVALGTTAESATLTNQEKTDVLNTFIKVNNKRLPLVMGLGGNNTSELVNTLQAGIADEVDAILSVCPYYNKPNQNGLLAHFRAIANATTKPIILYNVPGRTSSNMTASTTVQLANEFEHIIAIKEASGDLGQCMNIINNAPDDFIVISGEDTLTLPMISVGAKGVISVIAQAYPQLYSDMVSFALSGNYELAAKNHYAVLDITNAIFEEGNPAGIKYILSKQKICSNSLRLPLVAVSSRLEDKLNLLINKLG